MSDTLVKVDNVSKTFCRSLKRSLWYGMKDTYQRSWFVVRRYEPSTKHHEPRTPALPDRTSRSNPSAADASASSAATTPRWLCRASRNGAGKSTLLKMLNGLIKPDEGRIEMHGRMAMCYSLEMLLYSMITVHEELESLRS